MGNIKLFQDRKIRSVWNDEEEQWYFSIYDVVEALTDSKDPKQYIKRMRSRDEGLNSNWGTICSPLEMIAHDGKRRKVQTANVKGLFRIIQSIPSPKAEPEKRLKRSWEEAFLIRKLSARTKLSPIRRRNVSC